MFRKTAKEQPLGLFSVTEGLLDGRTKTFYGQQDAWHNFFRRQVTMRIEEAPYQCLFAKTMGAPNASIRVLIAMMILKEAYGWSDVQLFENCRYNLLVRSALGLMNLDDELPTESTYYLLRKRMVEHEKTTGDNLLEKTFVHTTKEQAIEFEVSGKSIRMDSKLLGSNIAWYSRYELVHETLSLFYQSIKSPESLLDKSLMASLKDVLKEEGNKVVYRNSREELKTKLHELGLLIDKLLQAPNLPQTKPYKTLCRVFSEQFSVDDNHIIITRPKEEIKSDSVQSPHDTDCTYRNKDGNQVKGYSINLTESCDKEELHLIGDVAVLPVSAPDNGFLQDGISQSEELFTEKIEKVYADGAYHSPENQSYCKEKDITLLLQAIQGPKGRYELEQNTPDELIVTDTHTGETFQATPSTDKTKWKIKPSTGGYRYFTQKEIDACKLRKQIENTPPETFYVRNGVEASIFQLGFHYPHDKSRYRGLIKHEMWACARCLWVNFVRIMKYVKQICQRTKNKAKSALDSFILGLIYPLYVIIVKLFIIQEQEII